MQLDLGQLDLNFTTPPLLIGGQAMEYYGLRPAGADIDLVVTAEDYARLARRYPDHLKEIGGDLGVCVYEFRDLAVHLLVRLCFSFRRSAGTSGLRVIALDKLLFLKALGMKEAKYHRDLELIVARVLQDRYDKFYRLAAQPLKQGRPRSRFGC